MAQEIPLKRNYRLLSNDWIVCCIAFSGLWDLRSPGLGKGLLYDYSEGLNLIDRAVYFMRYDEMLRSFEVFVKTFIRICNSRNYTHATQ
jgi:hypothetical protein